MAEELGICTMCESRPATTRWGAPVCQRCYDGLVGLQADLEQEEAADPELKALGQKIEADWRTLS